MLAKLPRERSRCNGRNHLEVRGEPVAKWFIIVRRLEIYAWLASSGNPEHLPMTSRTKSQENGQPETQAFQK